MTVLSVFACIVLVWALFVDRSSSLLVTRIARFAPSALLVTAATTALAPLYAAQLALLALQSRYENVAPQNAWMRALPIPVFDDRAFTYPAHALFVGFGVSVGLFETAALAIIVLGLRREPALVTNAFIAALACVFAVVSLAAPAMDTTDPYEFAASGILRFHSYTPSHDAFLKTAYEVYEKHIPMRRVVYGPLWLVVDIAQTSLGTSIYQKIEAIRITNIGFVGVFLWFLARARVSRFALIAVAVNPALWYYTVAKPHAEIEGLALLAGAYVYARRSKSAVATAFVFAAGLIKLPFVLIGGAMLSPLPSQRRRCAGWIVAILFVAVVAYLMPGSGYLANVSHVAQKAGLITWSQDWLALAPFVVVATAVVLALRRGQFGIAWLFHQLAPLAAPWYLFWGIPYAVAIGSLELYLVSFPLAATQAVALSPITRFVLFFLTIGLACDALHSRHRHVLPATDTL